MLKPEQVQQVYQLADKGHSQRGIARLTGLARETVRRILLGERPDYEAEGRLPDETLDIFTGPIGRCPSCGARVHLPCFGCQTQAKREMQLLVGQYRRLRRQGRIPSIPTLLKKQPDEPAA